MTNDRKAAERAFFDDAYLQPQRALNGFYDVSAGVRAFEEAILRGCTGLTVLEYGCGIGGHAFTLAERGAIVTGIDISEVAVGRAWERAAGHPRLDFRVADAEGMPFDPGSFDLICGRSILHHLDTRVAVAEVRRVLRPGGRAVFYEPVGYNPAANVYRMLTPNDHTEDEHPLLQRDFDIIRESFPGSTFRFYDFLSVAAIPLLRFAVGKRFLRMLDAVDRVIVARRSPLRLLGNVVVIEMQR